MSSSAANRRERGREPTDKSRSFASDRPWRSKVFISYSHRDVDWLGRLLVHFKPLERYRVIDRWDDSKITPGHDWQQEIRGAIDTARVAILLVSADFIASEFISKSEVPMLLDAARAEGLLVLPVILRPCRMPDSLARYQAVNSPQRTLEEMEPAERERVFVRLVETVVAWLNMSKSERIPAPRSAREPSGANPGGIVQAPVRESSRPGERRERSGERKSDWSGERTGERDFARGSADARGDDDDDRRPTPDRYRMEEVQREFARRVMETPTGTPTVPVAKSGSAEPIRSGSIVVDVPARRRPRSLGAAIVAGIVALSLMVVVLTLYLLRASPVGPPDPAASRPLDEADRALKAQDWEQAIDAARRGLQVLPNDEQLIRRQRLAERERTNQAVYDQLSRAAHDRDYPAAIARYDELPDASVYRELAVESMDQVKRSYLADRLGRAREAHRAGDCKLTLQYAREALAVDYASPEALALVRQCAAATP